MKKLLVGAVAALVSIGLLPMAEARADFASDEAGFVAQINDLRATKGLAALRVDAALTGKARAWAQTMAAQNRIWHSVLSDRLPTGWQKLGENVGMGGTVDGLHGAFVNSPGHYRNLVDPAFGSIGVGVVRVGATLFVAEEFMQTAVKKAPATIKPAKAKAAKAKASKARPAKKARRTPSRTRR